MFRSSGFNHGSEAGKDHARSGLAYRARPLFALSLVSKGYLDAYLKGYAQAYRNETNLIARLDREETLNQEREARKKARTKQARLEKRARILRSQNHERQKSQGDLER